MLLLVLAAGAAARFHDLGRQSGWYDEAFSWRIIGLPITEMAGRTARDVHPPLYYLLLKGWVECFGDSTVAMRSLSAALDVLGLVAIFGLAVDLCRAAPGAGDKGAAVWVGVIAAALAAASPFLVVHAREMRMYPLGVLLAVASSWVLWRALRGGVSVRAWAAYVITASGLIYTHNYGLFTVAVQAAFALAWLVGEATGGERGRAAAPRRLAAGAAFLAVGLIYGPWVPALVRQRRQVVDAYWIPKLSAAAVGGAVEQVFTGESDVRPGDTGGGAVLAAGVVLVALLARRRRAGLYLVLLSAGPLVMAVLVSLAQGRNILIGKYLAFGLPFYLIGVASLVGLLPNGWARAGVAAVLVGMSASQAVANAFPARDQAGGLRAAVGEILESRRPGDTIFSMGPTDHVALGYYLRGRTRPLLLRPPGAKLRHFDGSAVIAADEVVATDRLGAWPGPRAWVVLSGRGAIHRLPLPDTWKILKSSRFPESAMFGGAVYLELWAVDGGGPAPSRPDPTPSQALRSSR